MLAAPAVPGLSGKPKWGAAVLVRQHLGLRWPADGSGIVEYGRVLKVIVDIPSWPPLVVLSVYLKLGTGLSLIHI
eukprot:1869372-Pyramimonas_sp.AAC.1